MDIVGKSPALESVEDNEVTNLTPHKLANKLETKSESNGSFVVDTNYIAETEGKEVEVTSGSVYPKDARDSPSPAKAKGFGLRKWRRIRRDNVKSEGSPVENSKVLKRVLLNPSMNSVKPNYLSAEMKQNSEGSVSSTNAMVGSPGVSVDGFGMIGDSGMVIGSSSFVVGTDSDNSEDRSSKSSTAASAPKTRYEIPVVMGFIHDNNGNRSPNGRSLGNSVQRGQRGKGQTGTTKKPRGDRVIIEKENSHSSLESDSRSSNFVFMQGTNGVTSNGRQSGRSTNYDGEKDDEHVSEEVQTNYDGKDIGECEDNYQEDLAADSSGEVKGESIQNDGSSDDRDPLADSILVLQSTQEALEKELQFFKEIGSEESLFSGTSRESNLPSDLSDIKSAVQGPSPSDQLEKGDLVDSKSGLSESEMDGLRQKTKILVNKLSEVTAALDTNETKINELEAILGGGPAVTEGGNASGMQLQRHKDMEVEFECLFKQKVEAEVEYLTISRTVQSLRVAVADQISLFEEQKALAAEQEAMASKFKDIAAKAGQLEKFSKDIVNADETLKLEKGIWKYSSMLFIQLILLLAVLGLFVLQLTPQYAGVVPT